MPIDQNSDEMNTDVPSIQSTAQENLDLYRSIRKLTASETSIVVLANFGAVHSQVAESERAEDLTYEAARLIRSEGWLAQRSHVLSYRAHSGILEELA